MERAWLFCSMDESNTTSRTPSSRAGHEIRGLGVSRTVNRIAATGLGPAVLAICLSMGALADEAAPPPRYATTPKLEPDRCATAWVISRYLHPNAVFEFHEREDMPEGVILYDLPEAELKRDARRATIEVLIQKEGLEDRFLVQVTRMIHEIEINAWVPRARGEPSSRFETVLMKNILTAGGSEEGLKVCFRLLDLLQSVGGQVGMWAKKVESFVEPVSGSTGVRPRP